MTRDVKLTAFSQHFMSEIVCNRDCRASLESALAALHACLDHGVKKDCSFAAAFGGAIPGLRAPPAGAGRDDDRQKAIVINWLKRAIVQGNSPITLVFFHANDFHFPGNLVVILESINRRLVDKLASAYSPHSLLRDSEAVLLLTGTLTGICTSAPVKAAAAAAASPSPSSSPSIEAGAGGGVFTIGDARVRLMQAEAAKVRLLLFSWDSA
jgi:hypothetical protein